MGGMEYSLDKRSPGNRSNRTSKMYTNYFWRWLVHFKEIDVTQPVALGCEDVLNYLDWHKKHGGGRNTAIHGNKVPWCCTRLPADHATSPRKPKQASGTRRRRR